MEGTWKKLANNREELNWQGKDLLMMEVEGLKLTLARYRDKLYATAHACPHAGVLLADGYIDPLGNLVCPMHHYKFSLKTGYNTSGEGYFLKRWEVEEREDGVWVRV